MVVSLLICSSRSVSPVVDFSVPHKTSNDVCRKRRNGEPGKKAEGVIGNGKRWNRWDRKVRLPITKASDHVAWNAFLHRSGGKGTGAQVK